MNPTLFETTPVLPQNDSFANQLLRKAGLVKNKLSYVWSDKHPNAEGIPYAATVPFDETPSAAWLVKFAGAIVKVVLNFIASVPGTISEVLKEKIVTACNQIADYQQQFEDIMAGGDVTNPFIIQKIIALQASLMAVVAEITQLITSAIGELTGTFDPGEHHTEETYKALFATIPLPEIANQYRDDSFFAHLRVGGQNPMLLQGVGSLPDKFPLTNAQYQSVMGRDDDLAAAMQENRLYLLDYQDLGLLATSGPVKKTLTGVGYSYAPVALFALPKGKSALVPVAIQCNQDPDTNPIILPDNNAESSGYWTWLMAKTVVQNAEENYHEIFVHLARTHLVSEVFAMATPRNLSGRHPLYLLLKPHLEGAIFINEGAADTLLPPLLFIDTLFAAPISSAQLMTVKDRLSFDFYKKMLPADLASRKVDNPALHYPYRDDATLIWNAIKTWVSDYVKTYYLSDADVTQDYELSDWVKDVANSGKIKGFKAITSREQLIEVLTMVIFTASAQHAAVNFSQPDLCAYAPAISALLSAPAPDNTRGHSLEAWSRMLPPLLAAIERVTIYNVLGGVYYRKLGEYKSNAFPYADIITDPAVSGYLAQFNAALTNIESTINGRNSQRTYPYTYLLPGNVPASTNI